MKKKPPKGFDSWLEFNLKQRLSGCYYHSDQINYIQSKKYYPDFTYTDGYRKVYIEVKGRFRTRDEARKYVDVRSSLKDNESLVFIFQKGSTTMPGAKIRKDGTKMTHAEWATKNCFTFYEEKDYFPTYLTNP